MKRKNLLIACIALLLAMAAFLAVYFTLLPEAEAGEKTFTVTVVHADGSTETFSYSTDAEKLGAFLEEQGLIASEGADDGMFHTVDGEKADWNENKSYWAFYVDGEYAIVGIYDANITDGAAYKLEYTLG